MTPDLPAPSRAPDALLVCAPMRWVAEEMRAGADGRWTVVHVGDHHAPDVAAISDTYGPTLAWWATTGHAARLRHAGIPLQVAACPPWWLSCLPVELVGRQIRHSTLGELAASRLHSRGFLSPSQAKLDHLHSRVVDDLAAAAADAQTAGVPAGAAIDFTVGVVEFAAEYRMFVIDGQPVTSSAYRLGADTWDEGFEERPGADPSDALTWAAPVLADLHAQGRTPAAWVCDVGRLPDGRHVIVEPNAAWSSNTYSCDLHAVADAVAAATCGPHPPRMLWQPDPAEAVWASAHPLR